MVFALWNFAVVGLISIFWKGPLWLQQSYLTIMSSLMAFSLTGLEQWTTWILLGLLAIWGNYIFIREKFQDYSLTCREKNLDLIAVLCPFGPLRLLIESSKNQQREVPALLYSVNAVWFMMASNDHFRISNSMLGTSTPAATTTADGETSNSNETVSSSSKRLSVQQHHSPSTFIQQNFRKSHDGFMRLPDDSHVTVNSDTSSNSNSNPFATQTTLNAPDDTDRPSSTRQEEDKNKKIETENDEEEGK